MRATSQIWSYLGSPSGGIVILVIAMVGISINDMLIKFLSDEYPLHQMVATRSAIGLLFTIMIVKYEGGWAILRPKRPWLHVVRGLMIVFANMAYFTALAVMPLADATALFFVAPLFIVIFSIPVLGEKVGIRRISAVFIGLLGVFVMLRPGGMNINVPFWVLVLPVASAMAYAMMQVLTRKLGVSSKASAMALYIQVTFIFVGGCFYLVAGDGRYAQGLENPSLIFLLRAWVMPPAEDLWLFLLLGCLSAIIGYCLSQAYRLTDASTLAAYEYVTLPLAVMWGWLIFGSLPGLNTGIGIALIMSAGIYVFIRERARKAQT